MNQFNGKSVESKQMVLDFAQANGRLPSRNATSKSEVILASRMENYLSQQSGTFDASFRAYIFANFPRRSNYKRSHDKATRILELKTFISRNGRLPHSHNVTKKLTREEVLARAALDNYASPYSPLYDQEVYSFVKNFDPHYGNQALPISRRGQNG